MFVGDPHGNTHEVVPFSETVVFGSMASILGKYSVTSDFLKLLWKFERGYFFRQHLRVIAANNKSFSLSSEAYLVPSQKSMMKPLHEVLNYFWKKVHHACLTGSYSPTITCSKLTIETPEQGVKYVQG